MRRNGIILSFVIAGVLSGCNSKNENVNNEGDNMKPIPPVAEKIRKELIIHEHTRTDNYYWLCDRENPKVIDYLNAENAYTKKMLEHTKALQDTIFNEIVGRIKQDDSTVPYLKHGYHYYTRYEKDKEYPVICRKEGSMDAPEEILFNVNKMAEGFDYYDMGGHQVSPDNKLVAYSVDTISRRKYDIFVKDLETGEIIDHGISNTTGGIAWANDNKTLFYTIKDEALRPYKIMKHKLGTDCNEDKEVYHEADALFDCRVFRSKSDEYIMIESSSTMADEYRFISADEPDSEFKILQPRVRGLEYSVTHYKDYFYILTNHEARNFRFMKTAIDKPEKENWEEIIPHRENVLLEDYVIFDKYLVLEEVSKGLTQLRIIKWGDKSEHYLDFGEETYSAWTTGNVSFENDMLRFKYSSLTTPSSTFDYNMETREKILLKQTEIVGGFNPNDYKAERMFATARDSTQVPISLVYKKGLNKDGNNPLLLYSYGSYGSSTDAYFRLHIFSLLDRGFIFAIAHVRGGEEMGRHWYEDGKLLKKMNTFYDFNDCAEFLIDKHYTKSDKLFAYGGSAGGLLMGAIINLRPDLYKGVIAAVPFVDVITTMLDESIPLTVGEFDEWGNPKEKEYYDYMLSYSPYDNVEKQDYPALLVTTGLHDSQVQYWEPAKWVAKLRDYKTDNNMLLLHTNMEAGHGGASGRFETYREIAQEYAFYLNLAGIKE